jgi:uncharacterized protein (TIGR02597 family)
MPATRSRLGRIVPRNVEPLWCALVLLSFSVAGDFLRAASLVSEPVGCVRVVIPAPTAGETSRKVLGIPFNRPSVFRGIVTSVSGATLKAGTPAWKVGQFVSEPHYLKFRTGLNSGRYFTITANTADTITLSAEGVSFTEKQAFEIFPAQTLGSLFGTTSVPLRTGTSEATADFVRVHNGTNWDTYFHTGTQWQISGGTSSQNGVILRPEQGLIVVSGGTAALNLTLLGSVSVSPDASPVPGTGVALVSNRSPLTTTLSALNVQSLPGWTVGPTASVSDNLMRWNGSSWNVYYHTGARWQLAGSAASQDSATVPAGDSLLIRRRDGSTAKAGLLNTAASFFYTLSE